MPRCPYFSAYDTALHDYKICYNSLSATQFIFKLFIATLTPNY
ncbi:hypothetical protein [Candidatus Aquarickettsia rohweri]|nr:hypothetical protein [Candidatus Aquarickettsia rohweri]